MEIKDWQPGKMMTHPLYTYIPGVGFVKKFINGRKSDLVRIPIRKWSKYKSYNTWICKEYGK